MQHILEMLQCISMSLCRRRASLCDIQSDPPANDSKPFYAAADDPAGSTDVSGPEYDDDSFDGSDTESDSTDIMPNSEPSNADTDSEVDFSDEETSRTYNRLKTRSCRHQQNCRITRLDRHAVRSIHGAAARPEQAVHSDSSCEKLGSNSTRPLDSHAFGTLLHSLSMLTPEDAGELRSWLDDHLASQEVACPSVGQIPAAPLASHGGGCPSSA